MRLKIIYLFRKILDLCINLKKDKMKKLIYLIIVTPILFSCNTDKTVDLVQAKAEAEAFIDTQFDFFSSGSLEKAKETFAMDAVLIGTDEDEYLSGWAEVEPSLIGQIAVIKDPVFKTRNLNVVMGDDGNMASYTQLVDFTFDSEGQTVEITNVRSSGVIKKYDGKWKIAQIHWSVGVQGQVIEY